MKREAGFTLIEVLVATAAMMIIGAAVYSALTDAIHTTEGVTLLADTQQNLRAGMNYVVRDLVQAGAGIPQGGITIPNSGGGTPTSALNRPLPPGSAPPTFPTSWTVLPAISPGYQLGLPVLTPDPVTRGATVSGTPSDIINVIYADTTLVDTNGHWLNEFPIYLNPGSIGIPGCAASNPNPFPAGSIVTTGNTTTVTFDPSCIVIGVGNTALHAGDLIMLQSNSATALLTVSDVAGNSITFSAGDAFNLNASGQPAGTITQLQPYTSATITATRIWMISYYISNADPLKPQLMRQVNMNPPQAVGDVIENFNLLYEAVVPGTTPPSVTTNITSPTVAQLPYLRDVYVSLYARSENPFSQNGTYFRNNLVTAVSIRSLNFFNQFR
jgi:prepilin-type N-terminal cleavage/methylation domain-containing protein